MQISSVVVALLGLLERFQIRVCFLLCCSMGVRTVTCGKCRKHLFVRYDIVCLEKAV